MGTKTTLIRAGAVAGALTAIGGAVIGAMGFARPYMQSDPPPLASQARVDKEHKEIVLLAQNFVTMQQNQLFLASGFWTQQLAQAQDALRRNPSNPYARQQAITAQQQLYGIQRQLYHGAP
jgi:hypothetical protein